MKRYIAILNQTDSAPVATILENNIGQIVWSRASSGVYLGTLVGAFPASQTIAFCGDGQGGEEATLTTVELPANSEDYVVVKTKDWSSENGLIESDGLLVRTVVEIRVY